MDTNARGKSDPYPPLPPTAPALRGSDSAPAMRASDADRERAVAALQHAVTTGMLGLAEFEERTGRALVAVTVGDLDTLLADLRGTRQAPGAMLLETGSGKLVRKGAWVVPARLLVRCESGVVQLDTTEAECRHREVILEAECGSGQIRVTVPRDWTVRVESVRLKSGRVVDRTDSGGTGAGPLLRVFADLRSGTLRLRHPRR